jgi:hypothetical protein
MDPIAALCIIVVVILAIADRFAIETDNGNDIGEGW